MPSKNGISTRVKVLENNYDIFYKRFNEEIGQIRDDQRKIVELLRGRETDKKDTGLVGEVKEMHDELRNSHRFDMVKITAIVSVVTAIITFLLPRVFH